VSEQAWFATEIAKRFGSHPSIVGWLVSNEMPIYGGPATIAEITAWARLIVQSIRSAGVGQPISLGDGAWGIEVSGNDMAIPSALSLRSSILPAPTSTSCRTTTSASTWRRPSPASSPGASACPSC